ncbi:MAG: hypothetical protein HY001_01225, partial [Candidatus Portnoybacteria bacterium]|nr:hypothetical protein [Candidatus Portnoybacteria bacterium]
GITRGLNDIYTVREQLKHFIKTTKDLASEARKNANPKEFFLERVNFPSVREIYRDVEVPNFKVQSYYLHNRLLFVDVEIKEMNEVHAELKNDFEALIRQNEMLVAMMIRSSPNPAVQKQAYAENLEHFAKAIEDYISRRFPQGIKMMTQIKIYNDRLRKKYGYWFCWKCESTKFKYFRRKSEQKKFARNLDSLDRIDTIIEKQVESDIQDAEARGAKLNS